MKRPQLMGILNVTPDSFSDGGAFFEPDTALVQFLTLVEAGADIVDIGAESTRPGAAPLTHAQEWARLQPVLACIMPHSARKKIRVCIDTHHAQTARSALAMGVDMINDVNGLRDAAMREVLAPTTCAIVVMHALTIPVDPAVTWPVDADPIALLLQWKVETTAHAIASGISAERLIFDPGIGFGKMAEQSLALVQCATELVNGGGIWLYGHSKKSFLKLLALSDTDYHAKRDALTLQISSQLASSGVQYLRVHDMGPHKALLG